MHLQDWGPVLLAGGVPLLAYTLLGPHSALARLLTVTTCLVASARYMAWRWQAPLPEGSLVQDAWAWLFLLVETSSAISGALLLFFMSRHIDRSAQADAGAHSPLQDAPVDVFICTYNEGRDILERTIVGAVSLPHPDLRVWVLDDGARDWVRLLARQLGAEYVARVKGEHAKAGNVNNGLRVALKTGRRPQFILLLDADFVPSAHILRRTLPLFAEADVGIVQTPQHFFNPDPLQANLLCANAWPDEQRFFFNALLPCKDAWGVAFCCGTSAVFRTDALEQAGGMAVETVTEDMLTSFKLYEYGWRTIFLNERLSLGLAPEGLSEYVSQRARWCLGGVQQVYTRWSFAGRARISWLHRLSCLDSALYWTVSFLFRILVIVAPALFLLFGISTFAATPRDMLVWLAPAVVSSMVGMAWLSGNRVSPVMTDVSQLLSTEAILRTVARSLVKPFGHAFKVTAKGLATDRVVIQWRLLAPFALLLAATALGVLLNLSDWSLRRGDPGYQLCVAWSLYNMVVLAVTIAACVEPPRQRREERFAVDLPGRLLLADGTELRCRVGDVSVTGARITLDAARPLAQAAVMLRIPGELPPLQAEVLRTTGPELGLRFDSDVVQRQRLIAFLYSGRFSNEVAEVAPALALLAALRRAFG